MERLGLLITASPRLRRTMMAFALFFNGVRILSFIAYLSSLVRQGFRSRMPPSPTRQGGAHSASAGPVALTAG